MREEYVIEAFSPALNQSVREFHLEKNGIISITDTKYAQQLAESFATRLNQQQYLKSTDWQGRVTWQQLGIETLSNYISLK